MTTRRTKKADEAKADGPLVLDVAGRPRYRGSLTRGDKNLAVGWVNHQLAAIGLLHPPTTDQFTAETYRAVAAFQDAHGLRVTGRVDKATWILL